jgi:hypothetical protein
MAMARIDAAVGFLPVADLPDYTPEGLAQENGL